MACCPHEFNLQISQQIGILITRREQALFNLEIKRKSGSSINPDIHRSKVPSSDWTGCVQYLYTIEHAVENIAYYRC